MPIDPKQPTTNQPMSQPNQLINPSQVEAERLAREAAEVVVATERRLKLEAEERER